MPEKTNHIKLIPAHKEGKYLEKRFYAALPTGGDTQKILAYVTKKGIINPHHAVTIVAPSKVRLSIFPPKEEEPQAITVKGPLLVGLDEKIQKGDHFILPDEWGNQTLCQLLNFGKKPKNKRKKTRRRDLFDTNGRPYFS